MVLVIRREKPSTLEGCWQLWDGVLSKLYYISCQSQLSLMIELNQGAKKLDVKYSIYKKKKIFF